MNLSPTFTDLADEPLLTPSGAPPLPLIALLSSDNQLKELIANVASDTASRLILVGDVHSSAELFALSSVAMFLLDDSILRHLTDPVSRIILGSRSRDSIALLCPPPTFEATSPVVMEFFPRSNLLALATRMRSLLRARSLVSDSTVEILGGTSEIADVREKVRSIARFSGISVLLLGETGVGKELVASAIHRASLGENTPFVGINCAAIPESLFESELFGHEAGSFSGARQRRRGLLESGDGGTVFLDEIGELPSSMQPKLLRAIETRTFRRVGSNEDVPFNARIISATNRGISGEGPTLRPDLYYRLAGFTIVIPPLRQRIADIELLAQTFLRRFADRHQLRPRTLTPCAVSMLKSQTWPGNVRELRSVIEHAAIVARFDETEVCAAALRTALGSYPMPSAGAETTPVNERLDLPDAPSTLRAMERDLILRSFDQCGGNLSRTARRLGLPRTTLRDKLRRYRVA